MRRNRIGYFIKEGVESIFTHGLMSFASVCVIVACLIIMGSFSLVALNVDSIIDTLESENQMVAYVSESCSAERTAAIAADIKAVPHVSRVVFISRETAWESFVKTYDNTNMFDGLDASTLQDRYVIYLDDISQMESVRNNVRNVSGISKVSAHLEISAGFVRLQRVVTFVSISLVAILLVISMFIMSNTIKIATFERREEIAIMKMVGATSNFIRWPFVVEGLLIGLFASLLAFVMQYGIYTLISNNFLTNTGLSFIVTLPFSVVAVPLLIVFVAIGFLVGVVGSLAAIRNYLKV